MLAGGSSVICLRCCLKKKRRRVRDKTELASAPTKKRVGISRRGILVLIILDTEWESECVTCFIGCVSFEHDWNERIDRQQSLWGVILRFSTEVKRSVRLKRLYRTGAAHVVHLSIFLERERVRDLSRLSWTNLHTLNEDVTPRSESWVWLSSSIYTKIKKRLSGSKQFQYHYTVE